MTPPPKHCRQCLGCWWPQLHVAPGGGCLYIRCPPCALPCGRWWLPGAAGNRAPLAAWPAWRPAAAALPTANCWAPDCPHQQNDCGCLCHQMDCGCLPGGSACFWCLPRAQPSPAMPSASGHRLCLSHSQNWIRMREQRKVCKALVEERLLFPLKPLLSKFQSSKLRHLLAQIDRGLQRQLRALIACRCQ